MAQIRTIDGEIHNVKETKEELDKIMTSLECAETGILRVNMLITITSWRHGLEEDKQEYMPVSFIRANIVMYY